MHRLARRRPAAGFLPPAPPPEAPDPARALAGLKTGDARAIATLRGLIRQQLRWIDGPEERDWWEDLAQEVLVALLRSHPQGGSPDAPGAYLRRTVYAVYVDRLRKEYGRRRRRSDGRSLCWRRNVSWECCNDPRAAVPSLLDHLLHDGIGEALSRLGAPERRAVVLKYILGVNDAEAASLLGGSRSTYRRAVTRGVEAMRRTLTGPRDEAPDLRDEPWSELRCA